MKTNHNNVKKLMQNTKGVLCCFANHPSGYLTGSLFNLLFELTAHLSNLTKFDKINKMHFV